MTNELIDRVTAKTGLSAVQAKGAIDSVIGFLKEKLPAPIGSQLDSIVSGAGGSTAGGDGLMDKAKGAIGNLMGKS